MRWVSVYLFSASTGRRGPEKNMTHLSPWRCLHNKYGLPLVSRVYRYSVVGRGCLGDLRQDPILIRFGPLTELRLYRKHSCVTPLVPACVATTPPVRPAQPPTGLVLDHNRVHIALRAQLRIDLMTK